MPRTKGFTHDWQGTPYRNANCPGCGSLIEGPASRMPHLLFQHRLRCDRATAAERATRRQTGRWPPRPKLTADDRADLSDYYVDDPAAE